MCALTVARHVSGPQGGGTWQQPPVACQLSPFSQCISSHHAVHTMSATVRADVLLSPVALPHLRTHAPAAGASRVRRFSTTIGQHGRAAAKGVRCLGIAAATMPPSPLQRTLKLTRGSNPPHPTHHRASLLFALRRAPRCGCGTRWWHLTALRRAVVRERAGGGRLSCLAQLCRRHPPRAQ